MKRTTVLLFAVLTLVLSACGFLPQPSPTPSEAELSTQVAAILTSMPTAVIPSPVVVTATAAQPTTPVTAATMTATVTATSGQGEAYPAPSATAAVTTAPALTITPTMTPTSNFTPTPTYTPPATDPKLRLGNPSWIDTFTDGHNWPLGDDKYTSVEVQNGAMALTGLSSIDGWRLTWPSIQNFYLEMTAKTGDCKTTDRYGMILRVPDLTDASQGYLYGFTCDGRYALRKWDGKTMTSLIPWTSSSAILSGSNQTNRLGIMAVGNRFILYANGTLLKEADDSTYAEGGFGVFIGANQTENFTITIDQIAYWENPNP